MASLLPLALDHPPPSLSRDCIQSHSSEGVDVDNHAQRFVMITTEEVFLLYMGNLPLTATKRWIRSRFGRFGELVDVFVSK